MNTTGTPYFKRQPLKDVVVWYGLSEGIEDGILKESWPATSRPSTSTAASRELRRATWSRDFFSDYGDVRAAKRRPGQARHLLSRRPTTSRSCGRSIDQALVEAGQRSGALPRQHLRQTLTRQADIDAFNRLNDPAAPHRVILLVNKGTEGWNCPSLFASRPRAAADRRTTSCCRRPPAACAKSRQYRPGADLPVGRQPHRSSTVSSRRPTARRSPISTAPHAPPGTTGSASTRRSRTSRRSCSGDTDCPSARPPAPGRLSFSPPIVRRRRGAPRDRVGAGYPGGHEARPPGGRRRDRDRGRGRDRRPVYAPPSRSRRTRTRTGASLARAAGSLRPRRGRDPGRAPARRSAASWSAHWRIRGGRGHRRRLPAGRQAGGLRPGAVSRDGYGALSRPTSATRRTGRRSCSGRIASSARTRLDTASTTAPYNFDSSPRSATSTGSWKP